MSEAVVRFDNEDLEGFVAVGSYLSDAAKRFGIKFDEECLPGEDLHYCSVQIAEGMDRLSPLTQLEKEYFEKNGRKKNERLACQTKIIDSGEVVIMTEKKKEKASKEAAADNDSNEKYRKEFSELPFDQKISNLIQLEAIALGETFSYILNSPFIAIEKVMDVMAEFGFQKEASERTAGRPEEHKNAAADSKAKEKPPKAEA